MEGCAPICMTGGRIGYRRHLPTPPNRESTRGGWPAGGIGDEAKYLETARADRSASVWLMKRSPVVSQAWQGASASSSEANPNPAVAKVVLSLDPLSAAEPSLQARSPPRPAP
ncbi:hypothetical protein CFC21_008144 [Triticum aestivum]|uniref:Uncharacterized protein n=2 Tax=Triticum aestivum TaxID=4565 RepID=A0A9R1ISI8_WHEAT|nr:hypothetical protein CFC21_008144 [Triticum aestivum]